MFERFTDPARAVVVEAQSIAVELGSHYLIPAHLLYGCAETREETAGRPLHDAGITAAVIRRTLPRSQEATSGQVDAEALRTIGIDYDEIRAVAEQTFGAGALESAPDRHVPGGRARRPRFTPDAKRSLVHALRVAVELHHNRIRPGHLLLGLLRLDDPLITSAVEASQTDMAALSAAVLTRLSAA